MRYSVLLVLLAVAVLLPLTGFASDGADGDAPSNYYLEGYVADTLGAPLDDVTVTVTDASGNKYTGTYDPETGYFNVGVAVNVNLTISFTAFGHTAISCMSSAKQPNGGFALNLSKDPYNSVKRTYTITGSVSEGLYAIMRVSDGTVSGRVSYVHGPIKDAAVTLTPAAGGNKLTVSTGENGSYALTCPTGAYYLNAERHGFEPSEGYDIIVTETPLVQDISLKMTELDKHAGLDTAHLLMLIGVIVGIFLAVGAWFLSKRLNGPNKFEIFDDSTDDDEPKNF